jgi:hypothetical protein
LVPLPLHLWCWMAPGWWMHVGTLVALVSKLVSVVVEAL